MPLTQPQSNILTGTLDAIKSDISHFNQNAWLIHDKFKGDCGCFAWYAVTKFGDSDDKSKYAWDKGNDWVGRKMIGLSLDNTQRLFWGGNTLEDLVLIVDELITVREGEE